MEYRTPPEDALQTSTYAPRPTPDKTYLPHLAIYDHLPRNVDIFSDSTKYQSWAKTVFPRIPSPVNTRGLLIQSSRSEGHLLHNDTNLHLVSPTSHRDRVKSFKQSNQSSYNRSAMAASLNDEFPPGRNKKKVKPGLKRGSTVIKSGKSIADGNRTENSRSKPSVNSGSSSSISLNDNDALSYAFNQISLSNNDSYYSTPPLSQLANSGCRAHNVAMDSTQTRIKSQVQKKKSYISIALPVKTAAQSDIITLDSHSSNGSQHKIKNNYNIRKVPTKSKQGNRFPSQLSNGMVTPDRKQKTIPSFHEMSRSDSTGFQDTVCILKV